jgi:hypothetical protein
MLLLMLAPAALSAMRAAHGADEVRIPHLDGTGTETIIDVQPSIPGVGEFVHATPGPIPKRGEIIVPSMTPTSPAPTPPPRRY